MALGSPGRRIFSRFHFYDQSNCKSKSVALARYVYLTALSSASGKHETRSWPPGMFHPSDLKSTMAHPMSTKPKRTYPKARARIYKWLESCSQTPPIIRAQLFCAMAKSKSTKTSKCNSTTSDCQSLKSGSVISTVSRSAKTAKNIAKETLKAVVRPIKKLKRTLSIYAGFSGSCRHEKEEEACHIGC